MKKRTFLKSSSLAIASSMLPIPPLHQHHIGTNWSGNLHYSAKRLLQPRSVEEAQDMISKSSRIRTLGTRHCFNKIADCQEDMISSKELNQVLDLDVSTQTVTVEAGIRYGELSQYLHDQGFAVHNLASLPHISVAGAVATATHGSGILNGNLATPVVGMEIIRADGEVVSVTPEDQPDTFAGSVVNLGALGLVAKMILQIEPTFMVQQDIYRNVPLQEIEGHFDEVMGSGYSVSFFTDWTADSVNQIWIKRRVTDGEEIKADSEFFGGKLADRNMHPIDDISPENCTEQMGVPGPSHHRLPHFKLDFTPSSGAELQSEYFVPRENAFAAMMKIQEMGPMISPHLFISEIRTIAADNLWMSTAYERDAVAIHFTWKPEWDAVMGLLPKIEEALAPYDVRPHWGKLFTLSGETLASRYSRWDDFKALARDFDPDRKFQNDFLAELGI